ncbi:3957_t:CDS:10 [Entrophospora sp. SA101]|nr:9440_t:CDS:10 [Entrophospora candida]CAH1760254.1 15007_t:CDS:10 [Entrophospora sp. SA101]CAJ0849103.1 3957_t:CDS:10 [Entrophospora sp. SA101]CAJ0909304.1 6821_t:CDS:10 [Entrophospora sp. SA101]CAJ0909316.1 6824_t:CDS:10 [Entrophospora sp. SA101]
MTKKETRDAERLEQIRTRVFVERDQVSNVSSSDIPFHMYIYDNTSIIQDEVLAHRLGLIPIKANPDVFNYKIASDDPTDLNTVVFKIKHECTFNAQASKDETDPKKLYTGSNLLSNSLIWNPRGEQATIFANNPLRPVHDDILIAQLRPNQRIELEAHCEKGIGKEHAKWSPVATATYRLMPEIIMKKEITGDLADKFAACFTKGVVKVENKIVEKKNVKYAKVVNPRIDTVSREVLRHKEFEDIVQLTRIRDHFIFTVESTGILESEKIFTDALQILSSKCTRLLEALESTQLENKQQEVAKFHKEIASQKESKNYLQGLLNSLLGGLVGYAGNGKNVSEQEVKEIVKEVNNLREQVGLSYPKD